MFPYSAQIIRAKSTAKIIVQVLLIKPLEKPKLEVQFRLYPLQLDRKQFSPNDSRDDKSVHIVIPLRDAPNDKTGSRSRVQGTRRQVLVHGGLELQLLTSVRGYSNVGDGTGCVSAAITGRRRKGWTPGGRGGAVPSALVNRKRRDRPTEGKEGEASLPSTGPPPRAPLLPTCTRSNAHVCISLPAAATLNLNHRPALSLLFLPSDLAACRQAPRKIDTASDDTRKTGGRTLFPRRWRENGVACPARPFHY